MEDRGTLGVQIGGKHTLKDWNLGWLSITLGFPDAKTYEQEIPVQTELSTLLRQSQEM